MAAVLSKFQHLVWFTPDLETDSVLKKRQKFN